MKLWDRKLLKNNFGHMAYDSTTPRPLVMRGWCCTLYCFVWTHPKTARCLQKESFGSLASRNTQY